MHILVTNDDGVTAPGLLALAQAMRPLGQVTILAPDRNWSASGHVKTLHRPLRVREVILDDGSPALASDGAPSDCVALAMLGIIEQEIDLVVSGINPYANLSHDVTYSGTVTAAMEAVLHGVPGIAFSLHGDETMEKLDYGPAGRVAHRVVKAAVRNGLRADLLLNVNIPVRPEAQIRGVRITRQGQRVYRDALDHRHDPRGHSYYWIGGEIPTGVMEEGTDIGSLAEGFVSITPLQLDLTAYPVAQELSNWTWTDEGHEGD
jgi:5'-nucleotidase